MLSLFRIWICHNCRTVLQVVRKEIDSLKKDVNQLKTTTNLILSSINSLSDKLDNCVGGINDHITALKRHINQHDITITDEIENVSSKTLPNDLGDREQTKKCYGRTDLWMSGRTDGQINAIPIIANGTVTTIADTCST